MKVSIIGGGGLVGSMTALRPAVRRRRQQHLPHRRQRGRGQGPGPRPAARRQPDRRSAHHAPATWSDVADEQHRRHHRRPAPQARREPARSHQPQRRSVPGAARPGQGGRAQGQRLPRRRQQPGGRADLPGGAALRACRGSASSAWARSSTRRASAATWPSGCKVPADAGAGPDPRRARRQHGADLVERHRRRPAAGAVAGLHADRAAARSFEETKTAGATLIKLKGGSGFAVGLSIREVVAVAGPRQPPGAAGQHACSRACTACATCACRCRRWSAAAASASRSNCR